MSPMSPKSPMSKSHALVPLAFAVCLLAAWLVACNKKDNPVSPPPPGELNGSLAGGGGTFSHTFASAGTFNYHCSIHPSCTSLAGSIVVVAPGTPIQNRVLSISQSGGGGIYPSCSTLSVSRDTVQVGDSVTWTNSSPYQHTVVSE